MSLDTPRRPASDVAPPILAGKTSNIRASARKGAYRLAAHMIIKAEYLFTPVCLLLEPCIPALQVMRSVYSQGQLCCARQHNART
jgi:hypothetical protein